MYKNVELRKLPADTLCQVVDILEINDDWKRVMSIIPKKLQDESSGCKYNNEHIRLIEEDAKSSNQKCAEILMDDWGTSGRVRPTLSDLKNILIKAEIFRAADQIALMLKEPLPKRPTHGPPALITSITEILNKECLDHGFRNTDMSVSNKDHNGTTRKMESVSDFIQFSGNSKDKVPVEKESESNLINFSKDTVTQKSFNVPALSKLMASKNFSQKSTSPLTNDSSYTESSFQSYSENTNQNNSEYDMNNYQQSFPNIPIPLGIDSAILKDIKLNSFDYYELESITGNFSTELVDDPKGLRGKIGSGGFGDVFVGQHPKYGMLAVKKAHNSYLNIDSRPNIAMKIFNAEVKTLSQFRHKNIVSIIGYSKNGPTPCIVCEYIDGGSLEKIIEARELKVEAQRINIMVGIAEGLKYLHTSEESMLNANLGSVVDSKSQKFNNKFVHGDVKTANILLTKDYVPKLCDFGVAKQYDATFMTTCFMGTSAYMAPEALQGTVTQKTDIFSFGIVLLELLTGLKPIINHNGCNYNIKHFVQENCTQDDITPLLDPMVATWKKARKVYDLARSCFKYNWKKRPSITEIHNALIKINN